MRRTFKAWALGKVIRYSRRFTKDRIAKQLLSQTNQDTYTMPKQLKFPRLVRSKVVDGMQVFEMPPAAGQDNLLMYIHGGGYIHQVTPFHWGYLADMTQRTGYGFSAPNYPLLPRHTYEESHEKMLAYYRDFANSHDMSKVVLAGDSAGGGFAVALLEEAKAFGVPLPQQVILISPWVDIENNGKDPQNVDDMLTTAGLTLAAKAWANSTDLRDPALSPTYGDLTNLPPMHIYTGSYEIFNEQINLFVNKVQVAGGAVTLYQAEKMGHVFPLYPIHEAMLARDDMMTYLK